MGTLRIVQGGSLALTHDDGDLNDEVTSYTIERVEASGSTVLDSGEGVDPLSFAASRHWIYWQHAGVTRTAPIR